MTTTSVNVDLTPPSVSTFTTATNALTNLSSFSRDIQRSFGLPPSALRFGPELETGLSTGRRPDLRRSPGRD